MEPGYPQHKHLPEVACVKHPGAQPQQPRRRHPDHSMKRRCPWCNGSGTNTLFFQCPACRATGWTFNALKLKEKTMIKFLFRLAIFAVSAFVAIYLFQGPQGKREMQVFVQRTITAIKQMVSQSSRPGPSTTCPCQEEYRRGKWRTVIRTCPPGMSCAQCCN